MRVLIFALLLLAIPIQSPEPDLSWTVVVKQQNVYDYAGLEFFTLTRTGTKSAEAPTLTLSARSELASYLRLNEGKRVTVTFTVFEPKLLSREVWRE